MGHDIGFEIQSASPGGKAFQAVVRAPVASLPAGASASGPHPAWPPSPSPPASRCLGVFSPCLQPLLPVATLLGLNFSK